MITKPGMVACTSNPYDLGGKRRQENHEFEASVDNLVRLSQNKKGGGDVAQAPLDIILSTAKN